MYKQTRKRYFVLPSFNVQSFSRYRTKFSILQLLISSMLPTSVIPAITNAFSQYETFCLVFCADSLFSFKYASYGMISVWYNLNSDLTLSQISSDKKILSTVEKIFGNTLFKALDIWSVRLQIPPNAFVSLCFNGCMYQQFFRKVLKGNFAIRWETVFMYDNKQFCRNSFSSSHISTTSDAANMLLLLCLCQEMSGIWNFYH